MYQRMLAPCGGEAIPAEEVVVGLRLDACTVATGFQTGAGVKQYAPLAPGSGISRQ